MKQPRGFTFVPYDLARRAPNRSTRKVIPTVAHEITDLIGRVDGCRIASQCTHHLTRRVEVSESPLGLNSGSVPHREHALSIETGLHRTEIPGFVFIREAAGHSGRSAQDMLCRAEALHSGHAVFRRHSLGENLAHGFFSFCSCLMDNLPHHCLEDSAVSLHPTNGLGTLQGSELDLCRVL